MSLVKSEDGKKWINAFIALCSILFGYVIIRFLFQMGEWFDLEAKITYFLGISQGIGVVMGLIAFVVIIKNKKAMTYLNEVYGELVKVVWPERDTIFKQAIGIMIGLAACSAVFLVVDLLSRKILTLFY